MEVRDHLIYARRKIEKPEAWTRGRLARRRDGTPTHPLAPGARCFCLLGAMWSIVLVGEDKEVRRQGALSLLRDALPERYDRQISWFADDPENDHASMLALFDKAIAAA